MLFPTGKFIGVYFTEELKYAEKLGYRIYPISGYLYKRMESPFKGFVNELHKRRVEAKECGNNALSYIHKCTMNNLYGRFGISPESTTTEVLDSDEAQKKALEVAGLLSNTHVGEAKEVSVLSYKTVKSHDFFDEGTAKPPYNAAVQISAAVTAYARVAMFPYISRDDCYYTDTDSIVVKNKLPKDIVSASEIGKFKKEYDVVRGIF